MSIGSILSIARTAMSAHQLAVQVTSQNVANAEVEGYSRQRTTMEAGVPLLTPIGALGTGVVVSDVGRIRDALLDEGYRREAGSAAEFGTRRDLLARIESVFGEPSEQGLASTMDAFWSSWGDLASHPNSATARGVVQQRGEQLSFLLNNYAGQLGDIGRNTLDGLRNSLGELNDLARQVAEVNNQVMAAEVGGVSAPDLRDARDRLVDRMAKLAPVRTIEHGNGAISVYVENVTAVDGGSAKTFTLEGPPNRVHVDGSPMPQLGGSLGAMLEAVNTDVPGAIARLDALAVSLVSHVNGVHLRGWTAAGDLAGGADWTHADPTLQGSRVPFFDPATTGAKNISLSAPVKSDKAYVAVGKTQNGPADNWVALAVSQLRTATGMVGGESFSDHYRGTVAGVALQASSAAGSAAVYETLASQADTRRVSVSGVSTDEELVQLMRHQQAYAAAAKLVSAADEMAQTVLNMV